MQFAYPSYVAVEEVHNSILRMSGGPTGMISKGNLKFILDSVKDIGEASSVKETVARKAAHLFFGIISLHPFLDGNKRTAYEIAEDFIELNGWFLEPEEDEAFRVAVAIARGKLNESQTADWIARHLRPANGER